MPQYDTSRWAAGPDGSRYRVVGGGTEEGVVIDVTEGAQDLAAAYGVDLTEVVGTGSGGRITKADVESHLESEDDDADNDNTE